MRIWKKINLATLPYRLLYRVELNIMNMDIQPQRREEERESNLGRMCGIEAELEEEEDKETGPEKEKCGRIQNVNIKSKKIHHFNMTSQFLIQVESSFLLRHPW